MKQLVVCAALLTATMATGRVANAGNGTNLTKYVADTTQAMFVLDVSKAKSSKLVKDGFNKLLDSQADARAKLEELGLDPLRDIDTVMVAFGGFDEMTEMGSAPSMVIIVEARLPKNALAKLKSATKSTEQGVDIFARDDTEGALIDNKLFFTKKGQMSGVISMAKGTSKGNLASGSGGKELRETIKKASTKSHVWGAVVLPQKDRDKTSSAMMPIDAVSFAFKLASDVEGGLRLETPSEASAESTTKLLVGALPQIRMVMGGIGLDVAAGTIQVAQDKSAINARIKVSQTELKTLFAFAQSQKGAAGTPEKDPQPLPPRSTPPSGGLGKKKP